MRLPTLILLAAPLALCSTPVELKTSKHAYQDGKTLRVPMNETESDEVLEKWLSQAMSGLMAAVASKTLNQVGDSDRENLHYCSKDAQSVPDHARCVVKVLDASKNLKVAVPVKDTPISHLKSKSFKKATHLKFNSLKSQRRKNTKKSKKNLQWVGGFGQERRGKRNAGYKVVNKSSYTLHSELDETPMATVARQMTKTVRSFKNKKGSEGWREAILRVKNIGKKAKAEKKRREQMKRKLRQFINNTPTEFMDPRKPLALKQAEMEDEALAMKKAMAQKKKDEIRVPLQVLRESVKTALQLAGKNVTGFEKKTLKLASPRFLSIVPEQEEDSLFNLLSPSLFSLHDEGSEAEQLLSLPKMLNQLNNTGQEAWLDFIVEAAGVTDTIDATEKKQAEKTRQELLGENGVPLYFSKKNATEVLGDEEKRKIEVFEYLDKTYTPEQRSEMDKLGYAYLTDDQLQVVYGHGSPYNKSTALRRFRKMRRLRDDPHHLIETDIRALAEAEKFKVRRHDIVGSPFVLTPLVYAGTALSQPITLSPLVLSPIVLSPAVLGPITLSPWVFIPLVLSPRVLSPLILTPLIFSPIILSPLVLHPLILVPGIFNPFVLSPLVLSPFILSPQVFTPLILSPMVLNPLILTPMVGSPLILSPFVLSPIIVSPQALFALVLSPYALSPLIESKLIASEIVLSPSWLS